MLLLDVYDHSHGSFSQRHLVNATLAALIRRLVRSNLALTFHHDVSGVTGVVHIPDGYVSITARTQFRREHGVVELRYGFGDDVAGDYGTKAAEAPHLPIHSGLDVDDLADHFMRTMKEVAQRWSAGQPRAAASVRLVLSYP